MVAYSLIAPINFQVPLGLVQLNKFELHFVISVALYGPAPIVPVKVKVAVGVNIVPGIPPVPDNPVGWLIN